MICSDELKTVRTVFSQHINDNKHKNVRSFSDKKEKKMLPHLLGLALLGTAISSPLPQRVIKLDFMFLKPATQINSSGR
jgi:hypothetical protein